MDLVTASPRVHLHVVPALPLPRRLLPVLHFDRERSDLSSAKKRCTMDRFSPVAPAFIRVLVLPVGEIERQRFLEFLSRLQKEAWLINLTDVERYVDDHERVLSPKAFPKGSILYNYSTSTPSPQLEQLSPLELFREPLLVLGVIDGEGSRDESDEKELGAGILRERYPRVVHRQLVILEDGDIMCHSEDDAIRIGSAGEQDDKALKDAMSRTSARFLKELSTYTRAMQASPSVTTPGQTARSLQRTVSHKEEEKRPSSYHSTPIESVEAASQVESGGRVSPATSFDQMPSANSASSNISRSDSRASNKSRHTRRASSQDRVSVQGFGSGTSQDKLKQRGKARVGIVVGSIYMAAGQWSEALKILVENTNKARILSDHIWHAKGLENVIVCLLLHSWAGLEFQIPSICYPVTDKSSAQQRFSVNLPADFRPADAAQLASVRRLSTSLPDLLKLVLSLYRSVEGSLELPAVAISEATVRFCKLLAVLHNAGGELDRSTLSQFLEGSAESSGSTTHASSPKRSGNFSKATIADILSHAQPPREHSMPPTEQAIILAGIASVYALLQMNRKKANVLKDLVAKLTVALTQARKRGAAEAGIHPAASLSVDTGADGILASAGDSKSVDKMMNEIARIYGAQLPTKPDEERSDSIEPGFGNDSLKISVLRHLTAFYEAAPDPYGVLDMTTVILSAFGPNAAVDIEADRYTGILSKEDQARLTATVARTIGVSKHIGLPGVVATYWDQYLVRGVEFVLPDPNMRILETKQMKSRPGTAAAKSEAGSGNPLLYDPNANRPGTAARSSESVILVANEAAACLVTLQNPYDVPVDIESISLVTDGSELRTSLSPFTLHPARLQKMPLTVFPSTPGDYKISQVRVKISGCAETAFPIVSKAWAPEISTLVKDIGQSASTSTAQENAKGSEPEHEVLTAKIIEPQPTLALEDPLLQDSSIMLLDGEKYLLNVAVRNTSDIALSIFSVARRQTLRHRTSLDFDRSSGVSLAAQLKEAVVVEAGHVQKFEFTVDGRADISGFQISFMYSAQGDDQYSRALQVSINLTVNAALQTQHFNAMPVTEAASNDHFILSFDLRNAWPRPLKYVASASTSSMAGQNEASINVPKQENTLNPGQIERVFLTMPRLLVDRDSPNNIKALTAALLESLSVEWSCDGRTGEADLSDLILNAEEIGVVSRSFINLSLSLKGALRPLSSNPTSTEQVIKVGSFVSLVVKVATEGPITEPLFVQLRSISQDSRDGDMTTRDHVVVNGCSHRVVRLSRDGYQDSVVFSLCPVMAGHCELEVVAKPAIGKGSKVDLNIARCTIRMKVVQ